MQSYLHSKITKNHRIVPNLQFLKNFFFKLDVPITIPAPILKFNVQMWPIRWRSSSIYTRLTRICNPALKLSAKPNQKHQLLIKNLCNISGSNFPLSMGANPIGFTRNLVCCVLRSLELLLAILLTLKEVF